MAKKFILDFSAKRCPDVRGKMRVNFESTNDERQTAIISMMKALITAAEYLNHEQLLKTLCEFHGKQQTLNQKGDSIAGALVAAEIDRLRRIAATEPT